MACFRRGGAGDGRRGLERSGRALESGREDGRRPRATNANLVAHSALPTSRSRTPRGPRSARPGRSGKGTHRRGVHASRLAEADGRPFGWRVTRCARGDAEEWPCARRRRQENIRPSRFLPYLTLKFLGWNCRLPLATPESQTVRSISGMVGTSFGDVKTREISFADVLTTDPTRRDRQSHPRVRPGVTRRAEHARAVALHVRDTARVRARRRRDAHA